MIGDDVRAAALVVEANLKDQVWQGLSLRLNDYSLHKPGPEGFCLFEHGHNTYEQVFGQAFETHTGLGFQLGEQHAPNGEHTDGQNHDSQNFRNWS